MALIGMQKLALQLYTNQKLQADFFLNPEVFAGFKSLGAKEKNAILELPRRPIHIFYHSLAAKRLGSIKRVLKKQGDGALVISSFYKKSPAIFFLKNGKEQIEEIGQSEFFILSRAGRDLTAPGLFSAFLKNNGLSNGNLWKLALLFAKSNLWGRAIIIL